MLAAAETGILRAQCQASAAGKNARTPLNYSHRHKPAGLDVENLFQIFSNAPSFAFVHLRSNDGCDGSLQRKSLRDWTRWACQMTYSSWYSSAVRTPWVYSGTHGRCRAAPREQYARGPRRLGRGRVSGMPRRDASNEAHGPVWTALRLPQKTISLALFERRGPTKLASSHPMGATA